MDNNTDTTGGEKSRWNCMAFHKFYGADLRVSVCAESLCLVAMVNRRLMAETH